jgi:acyl-CoA synthetase (AMP-forming)/AMP-acid ligase II
MAHSARSLLEVRAELTAPGAAFELDTVDVDGVTFRTWKHAPAHLVEILERSRSFADREFIIHEGQRVTFAEHYAQAATMARRLIDLGVSPGDRVAIAARNLPQGIVTFWGSLAAGATIAPLNAWWTSEELAYGLNDSAATVLVVDEERLARLRKQFNHLEHLRHIVVISDDPAHAADLGKPHDVIALRGFQDFLGAVDHTMTLPAIEITGDHDATIFYTAGTTSKPKGAVATHRNSVVSIMSLAFANRSRDLAAGVDFGAAREITLLNIPLFHVTGALAGLVAHTAAGGALVTMRHFDAGRALALIQRERVTTVGGVPTIVQQLLAHPDFKKFDLASIRSVSYGGAPVPENLPARVQLALPRAITSNGYGLTETSALVAQISGQEYLEHPTSRGTRMRRLRGSRVLRQSRAHGGLTLRPQRGGRTLGEGSQCRARLLEETPGDVPVLLAGLGANWRHRSYRRRRADLHRRPIEGHDHSPRRERVPVDGGGAPRSTSRNCRVCGNRTTQRRRG